MTGTVLTNNGLALITKLVAAKATLEFSRVAVGTGKVPQGVDPQAMISLNAYKMDAQISSYGVSPDQEDVAYIVTQVSSIGVSAGFAVTEGGVFANDPDKGEILFAYLDLTEDPQYVYAETDSISKFVEITFNVLIGSVEKVTAYVTPGALVKKVEFEELEKRVAETENPTFEDYTGDISVPTASAAIEEIKSKSKLGVLLSNIKAAFKGACLIGHIVNNCVTDNPNLPLSAAQGKALMDAITVLNTKTGSYTHEYENFTETVLGKYVQYSFYGRQWTFSSLPVPNGNTNLSFVVSLVGSKNSIAHMNIDTDGRVSLYDQDWSEISASSDILIRGTIGYYLKIQ